MAAKKDSQSSGPLRWFQSLRDRFRSTPPDASPAGAPAGRAPEPDSSLLDLVDHDFDSPEEDRDRGVGETRGKDPNEG